MKNLKIACFLQTLLLLSVVQISHAQMWTATDWQNNPQDLSTHLNAGKTGVVDISAHWCGPCWAWHNSKIMDELYHDFGPSGTDEFFVYFIDADAASTVAILQGANPSLGDWTAGTPYPIIGPNAQGSAVASNYSFPGYPTLFLHCGSGTAPEIDRNGKWAFWSNVMNGCPSSFTSQTVDATLLVNHAPAYICQGAVNIAVDVYNAGTTNLSSFDIELRDPSGALVHTESVAGQNIAHGSHTSISISFAATQGGTWWAKVVNPNGTTDPRPNGDEEAIDLTGLLIAPSSTGTMVTVEIVPDNYGSETTWDLRDHTNTVILSGGPFDSLTTMAVDSVMVTGDGCYLFTIYDSFGDGICCSYGYGSYTVKLGSATIVSGGEFASQETKPFEVNNSPSTGIEQISFADVSLLPTVTDNKAILLLTPIEAFNLEIELFNIAGKMIKSVFSGNVKPESNYYEIDLTNMPTGQYIVNIRAGNGEFTKRLIKMN